MSESSSPVTSGTAPVIAVIGPGAIGGLVAAFLQRAGHDVVLVGRAATVKQLNDHGLELVTDKYGSWHSNVRATTELPRGARVVVAVKAEGVDAAVRQVAGAEPTEVVALLNGLEHMEVLRAAAPDATVVGATIAGETLRSGAGSEGPVTVRHRNDLLRIVVPDDAWELSLVGALRDTDIKTVTGGTEGEVLWKKLRFLAPFALLTSTWESGVGDALDADPGLAAGLVGEIAAVATAEGVPTTQEELLGILRGFPRPMRSSLQADIESGKPGELDAIGGAVARRGAAHGIETPALDATIERLRARVGG